MFEHSRRNGDYFHHTDLFHKYSFNSIPKDVKILIVNNLLEYPWVTPKRGEYYLRSKYCRCNTLDTNALQYTESDGKFLRDIKSIRKVSGLQIILLAFGTSAERHVEISIQQYQLLLTALVTIKNIIVIVVLPVALQGLALQYDYDKFKFYSFIPQKEALAYCDFMITHGGLNSITECVQSLVPCMICPLVPGTDQYTNAAKVNYYRIGLGVNIRSLNIESIIDLINQFIRNRSAYISSMLDLRNRQYNYEFRGKSVDIDQFLGL